MSKTYLGGKEACLVEPRPFVFLFFLFLDGRPLFSPETSLVRPRDINAAKPLAAITLVFSCLLLRCFALVIITKGGKSDAPVRGRRSFASRALISTSSRVDPLPILLSPVLIIFACRPRHVTTRISKLSRFTLALFASSPKSFAPS